MCRPRKWTKGNDAEWSTPLLALSCSAILFSRDTQLLLLQGQENTLLSIIAEVGGKLPPQETSLPLPVGIVSLKMGNLMHLL